MVGIDHAHVLRTNYVLNWKLDVNNQAKCESF